MSGSLPFTSALVTGGSGFLGSALAKRLADAGVRVRVLDDGSRGHPRRLSGYESRIEIVTGDVRDAAAVRRACEGMEAVWHLAYINGTEFFYSMPETVLEVGVKGTLNAIEGARAAGTRHFILASSSEVYQSPARVPTDETAALIVPDPFNPRFSYGGGKIISELLAIHMGKKAFGRTVIFRPHNVYGPDMGWEHVVPQFGLRMKGLAAGSGGTVRFPIQGDGRQTRAFIYIDDFTDGLMILAEKAENQQLYHVGTMDEISIADVAREVGRWYGRDVELVPGESPAGGTPRRCPDTGKIAALGFRPKADFRTGLAKTLEWYDKNAALRPEKGVRT